MAKLLNLIPTNSKPKQNEALEDMEVALPSKIERFLERLVQTIKSYNLPKKKEQAVIARVMDSMGITTSELNQTVAKLKKYDVVKRQKTGNADHDWMGEQLNEAKLSSIDDKVANLYSWAGIKTKYDKDSQERFGPDVIKRAIEMAPKVIAFKKKLQKIEADIKNSDEGKILIAQVKHGRGYGGAYNADSSVGDLFN